MRNFLTTKEFADKIGMKPASIRVFLCRHGSYHGIKPIGRMPNGWLIWPKNAPEKFFELGRIREPEIFERTQNAINHIGERK